MEGRHKRDVVRNKATAKEEPSVDNLIKAHVLCNIDDLLMDKNDVLAKGENRGCKKGLNREKLQRKRE